MTLRRGIVLVLLGGALSALGCALVWFSAPVDSVVVREVAVTGSQVAPGAMPLLLVVAAGLVARAMTRGVVRRVIGWLGVLAWVGLVATLVAAALDPVGPLLAEAAEATGVGQLAGSPARGPWPWLAVAGAAIGCVGGVAVALARGESTRGSRYERAGTRAETGVASAGSGAPGRPDQVEDWDALTRGDDPSEGENQVG
ncbi:Trp biosynthesis-associated membrane protein [Salana multivorans]